MLSTTHSEKAQGSMRGGDTPIAIVLTRWMHRERLKPIDVERASGLSHGQIWLVRMGRVARPSLGTIEKLARGLATDPDGVVDAHKRTAARRELAEAAGWDDLADAPIAPGVEAALRAAGLAPQTARFYADLAAEYPEIDPATQQIVRGLLDRLRRRPGGDDVTNWLLDLLRDDRPAPA
jgi:transcriptional regulator with XRE-family HTH domain